MLPQTTCFRSLRGWLKIAVRPRTYSRRPRKIPSLQFLKVAKWKGFTLALRGRPEINTLILKKYAHFVVLCDVIPEVSMTEEKIQSAVRYPSDLTDEEGKILSPSSTNWNPIPPERRHCSRNPKWGPSDVGCEKLGDGHGLRRPAFVLRPSRRALRAAPGLPQ